MLSARSPELHVEPERDEGHVTINARNLFLGLPGRSRFLDISKLRSRHLYGKRTRTLDASWSRRAVSGGMVRAEPASLSCLVVEDDVELLEAIARHAERELKAAVWTARSLIEGRELMNRHKPRVIITDVYLGEERCHDLVVEALSKPPFPTIVAISGKASPEEAFALAALGVRSYLAKPLMLSSLRAVLTATTSRSPQLMPGIAAQVGTVPIDVVKRDVRVTMLTQALALTAGNRTECARILGVTRQAVQHMIRELEIDTHEYNEP